MVIGIRSIVKGDFSFFMYDIQHCFICRPSESTVPEDAGIEPRTVATTALAVRRSNHSARSHPQIQFHVPYKKKKAPSKNPKNPKNPAGGNSLVFFLLSGWSPARNCQINLKIQGSVWLGGKSGAGGNYSERENESERQIKRKLNENLSIKGKRSGMKAGWTHWMGQCSRKQLKVFQMC